MIGESSKNHYRENTMKFIRCIYICIPWHMLEFLLHVPRDTIWIYYQWAQCKRYFSALFQVQWKKNNVFMLFLNSHHLIQFKKYFQCKHQPVKYATCINSQYIYIYIKKLQIPAIILSFVSVRSLFSFIVLRGNLVVSEITSRVSFWWSDKDYNIKQGQFASVAITDPYQACIDVEMSETADFCAGSYIAIR